MRELLSVMKALSDANRLRIVAALGQRELCLCQIVELLGLATSTASKHMSILQHARLVDSRKDGRWSYFRLAEDDSPPVVQHALSLVLEALASDNRIKQDARLLKRILKLDPEALCKRQVAYKTADLPSVRGQSPSKADGRGRRR